MWNGRFCYIFNKAPCVCITFGTHLHRETHTVARSHTHSLKQAFSSHFLCSIVCVVVVCLLFSRSKPNINSQNNNKCKNDNIFVAFNLIIICGGAHTHTHCTDVTISVSSFLLFHRRIYELIFLRGLLFFKKKSRCCWANTFFGSFKFVHSMKRECVCLCACRVCVCSWFFSLPIFRIFHFVSDLFLFFLLLLSNAYHFATCGSEFSGFLTSYWSRHIGRISF